MGSEGGTARQVKMKDHNGVLMMQRVLLAGTIGLAMARKAAAILEGEPNRGASWQAGPDSAEPHDPPDAPQNAQNPPGRRAPAYTCWTGLTSIVPYHAAGIRVAVSLASSRSLPPAAIALRQ
jgi:hypothetical protein